MKLKIKMQFAPSRVTNDELIEACRSGDHKAQLMVYKLYYKPVYNLCLGIVRNPDSAELLMHESFLSAFENISEYKGDVSFSKWVEINLLKHL